MPTYEYCCDACGHEFEVSQRITELPIRTCVKCKKPAVVRKISKPSFILKGGGWYADGYSRGAPKAKWSDADAKPVKAPTAGADAKS